ncbi:MAG: hypothetical protein KKB50_22040 [Planctomycetes bacterium]|nr:hypothetical protein [Planctomycetota bacterium]
MAAGAARQLSGTASLRLLDDNCGGGAQVALGDETMIMKPGESVAVGDHVLECLAIDLPDDRARFSIRPLTAN